MQFVLPLSITIIIVLLVCESKMAVHEYFSSLRTDYRYHPNFIEKTGTEEYNKVFETKFITLEQPCGSLTNEITMFENRDTQNPKWFSHNVLRLDRLDHLHPTTWFYMNSIGHCYKTEQPGTEALWQCFQDNGNALYWRYYASNENPCPALWQAHKFDNCWVYPRYSPIDADNCPVTPPEPTRACSGCSLDDKCREFNNIGDGSDVFGCECEFKSGVKSGEFCCNAGYHICKSSNELKSLGFDKNTCKNTLKWNEVYFTLEESSSPFKCRSAIGGPGSNNDVWGCTGASIGKTRYRDCVYDNYQHFNCGVTNIMCMYPSNKETDGITQVDWYTNPWTFPNSDGTNELTTMSIKDGSDYNTGVLCCKD